jgi:DNA-binding MarR family transcriptional regulator
VHAGRVIDSARAPHLPDGTASGRTPGEAPAAAPEAAPGDEPVDLRAGDSHGWAWGDEGAKPPPDAPLSSLVSVAIRLLGAFLTYTAQCTGMSLAGTGVLRLLAAHDGLKSSEVAARGWSTPGTVTSVVDTLVRDGCVERRRDPGDRRVVRLYLTEEGRRRVTESVSVMGPKWHDAFDYVDPADEPAVRKFLVDTIERFGTLVREERGR